MGSVKSFVHSLFSLLHYLVITLIALTVLRLSTVSVFPEAAVPLDSVLLYNKHLTVATTGTFGSLSSLVNHTSIKLGVMTDDKLITNNDWAVERNLIVSEYNSVTLKYGFFGTIHPCPPRELVDSRMTSTYNLAIHAKAKEDWRCALLREDDPAAVNWTAYESAEWHWQHYDSALLWARDNGIAVHFQTLFWEFDGATILPDWLSVSKLGVPQGPGREELAHDFLFVMEEHIDGVVSHLCGTRAWAGTVYAIDVLNEVTEGDGSVRTLTTAHPFSWALINEIQSDVDPGYTGNPDEYYIYKAFALTQAAVESYCGDTPPILVLNDKFPVDAHWTSSVGNPWAQGAFNLITGLNDMVDANLIEGVGIQAHINIRPTANPPINPVAGLRQILEAFDDEGLEVQITELDVSILKATGSEPFPQGQIVQYFDEQAETYRQVTHACLYETASYDNYAPICTAITTWGLFDRASWKDCYSPLMYGEATPYTPDAETCNNLGGGAEIPKVDDLYFEPAPTALQRKPSYLSVYYELRTIPGSVNIVAPTNTPSTGYPAPLMPTPSAPYP